METSFRGSLEKDFYLNYGHKLGSYLVFFFLGIFFFLPLFYYIYIVIVDSFTNVDRYADMNLVLVTYTPAFSFITPLL